MLSLVPFKKGVGFLVSPLNRTLISVTVDVILRETDRDLAVDRSSVLEHKATLGGRNGFQSFAAKSLLLVADELFNLLLLRVNLLPKALVMMSAQLYLPSRK